MAASRPTDVVRVEVIGDERVAGGVLDNFTSLSIRNDITMPSEASFEVGDDGTWNSLGEIFRPGTQFQVFINDRPRLRGRVEMNDVPFDTGAGAVVRFTIRTKLSDAMYASANQRIRVKDTSIKDFILAVYKPLGYTEDDFEFAQYTAVNLLTGQDGPASPPKDLEKIKIDQARVKPPESIYAAADRHLRRHGMMHWDDPCGKIIVGAPDDEQDPLFTFNMWRTYEGGGDPQTNNVLNATRTRDWSGLPATVGVYGRGGKRDFTKSRVASVAKDQDVIDAGFYRPLQILAEGIRTQALADRASARELSARSKRKDGFSLSVDGWTSWDGYGGFLYAPDTTCMINTDVAGGEAGAFYIHAVTLTTDADGGNSCQMDMVKRGIWRLG